MRTCTHAHTLSKATEGETGLLLALGVLLILLSKATEGEAGGLVSSRLSAEVGNMIAIF